MRKPPHPGRYQAMLLLMVLPCLTPAVALAQDGRGWHASSDDDRTSLYYGSPQDYYPDLSFSCVPDGGGLTFAYIREPLESYDGVEMGILLEAGDIEIPIRTFGVRLALDSKAFVFEGRVELDDGLVDLITSGGTLHVRADDGAGAFPLEGASEAAAPFVETCRGHTVDAEAIDIRACTIHAWSIDQNPNGLNVRAGPGSDTPIIGNLPPPVEIDDYAFKTEVSITGSKNGWFRIDRGSVVDYLGDEPDAIVFEGEGWVSGRYLGLLLNHHSLYAKPSIDAEVVTALHDPADGRGPDSFVVDGLHACVGHWVEVEGDFPNAARRGWTTGTCANQITTCP